MASFVDHLGPDPKQNQGRWERCYQNPVIPFGADWSREFIAPSSVLVEGELITLFAEGGADDRECIGRYTTTTQRFLSTDWTPDHRNPILEPSLRGFDRGSVFDPAVIRFGEKTHLYYSATAGGAHAFAERFDSGDDYHPEDEVIGLAVETELGFSRRPMPVVVGRCPNVIEADGTLTLFYVDVVDGGYRIYAARSSDGIHFEPLSANPVLDVGGSGAWDSFTVTTPKVFVDDGAFVMLYSGDSTRIDDPTGIGVAVSDDLVHWRKHPGNPILAPGRHGAFDSLSVANAVPFLVHDAWYIAYAGGARPVADGLQSQIGIARLVEAGAGD